MNSPRISCHAFAGAAPRKVGELTLLPDSDRNRNFRDFARSRYPLNINPCTLANNTGLLAFNLLKLLNIADGGERRRTHYLALSRPKQRFRLPIANSS